MPRVFVSTFAKNFQVRRSNPLRGPFAVKYLFICGSVLIAFPELMTYSYISKIEPQNKFGTKKNRKINLERKKNSKINLERKKTAK